MFIVTLNPKAECYWLVAGLCSCTRPRQHHAAVTSGDTSGRVTQTEACCMSFVSASQHMRSCRTDAGADVHRRVALQTVRLTEENNSTTWQRAWSSDDTAAETGSSRALLGLSAAASSSIAGSSGVHALAPANN